MYSAELSMKKSFITGQPVEKRLYFIFHSFENIPNYIFTSENIHYKYQINIEVADIILVCCRPNCFQLVTNAFQQVQIYYLCAENTDVFNVSIPYTPLILTILGQIGLSKYFSTHMAISDPTYRPEQIVSNSNQNQQMGLRSDPTDRAE